MARMIPAAERIIRARALIQKARELPKPTDLTVLDLSYMAGVKDLLQQARDLIKFIPYTPTATPEMKEEVKQIFADADQVDQELLHNREKRMSNKKRSTPSSQKRAAQQARRTQTFWIGLVIVVLAVAGIIWLVTSLTKPASTVAATAAPVATGSGPKQYSAAPPMTIDKTKQYFATVKMAKGGEFVIQLYPDKAPITVNSFVFLAREGFFNGVTFHRVLDGFMAQGGDPTGTGTGGPGYEFQNENSDLTFDKAGVVAMANAGPNTNGSQFFITFAPQSRLNGGYTIFGQVISGMDVVNGLTRRDPEQNPNFSGDAISSITITEK